MHLTVTGKQVDIGDALREHISQHLMPLIEKYFSNPIEAAVTFSRTAHLWHADVLVHVGRGLTVHSEAEANGPYPAFYLAAERMGKRLRRHKRRLRDRHRADTSPLDSLPANQYILDAGWTYDGDQPDAAGLASDVTEDVSDDGQPVVVAEMQTVIETLTVGEAVMRLDLSGMPAMMFRNRAHGGLNMVYRRTDGNIGWVDPKGTPTVAAG